MKTLVLTATLLGALAFVAPAAAGPIVCLGSGCPGGVLMCLTEEDPADCAGVPPLTCPAVYYEIEADPVVVGYGPCANVDVYVFGENLLP